MPSVTGDWDNDPADWDVVEIDVDKLDDYNGTPNKMVTDTMKLCAYTKLPLDEAGINRAVEYDGEWVCGWVADLLDKTLMTTLDLKKLLLDLYVVHPLHLQSTIISNHSQPSAMVQGLFEHIVDELWDAEYTVALGLDYIKMYRKGHNIDYTNDVMTISLVDKIVIKCGNREVYECALADPLCFEKTMEMIIMVVHYGVRRMADYFDQAKRVAETIKELPEDVRERFLK
jgi:hypothetical protein